MNRRRTRSHYRSLNCQMKLSIGGKEDPGWMVSKLARGGEQQKERPEAGRRQFPGHNPRV
jgi:hypothetical protein